MLSRLRLTTMSKAVAAITLLLFSFTACRNHQPQPEPKPKPPAAPPKIAYNESYDRQIKEIMDLAGKDRWEEAQIKADALYQKDPKNPMVERVHGWVIQAGQKRREQALEDKIRDI